MLSLGLLLVGCTLTPAEEPSEDAVALEDTTPAPEPTPTPTPTGPRTPTPPPSAAAATPAAAPPAIPAEGAALLHVVEEKDGDSFVASDGVEYRVGMVNAPERSACGGTEASERAYELMSPGFTTEAYATDDYGRSVARIHTSTGDLGVLMAREGLFDDRYLDQFRHQHPGYASELDTAFAEARATGAGLWQTCWAPAAQDRGGAAEPATDTSHNGRTGQWPCHPAYRECLPDGPDLDCAEVGHTVELLGNDDPFRLDGNSTTATDGWGCDTYPAWSPTESYPYYDG
ncbi:MAG: thermonuclease family protein [Actinomycetota bacterium]